MQLAMTMTATSRPAYLREVLQSLQQNEDLEHFKLHFGVEPGNAEVLQICEGVSFMQADTHLNPRVLGVRENPFRLLSRVFDLGYEGVLYLEDDVVLSPDAVRLARWYLEHPTLPTESRCLCLFNMQSQVGAPSHIEEVPASNFTSLGFAATREQWLSFLAPMWGVSPRGWDWSIVENGVGSSIFRPSLSRSHHIGRHGGVHYVPGVHDAMYLNNVYATDLGPPAYEVVR